MNTITSGFGVSATGGFGLFGLCGPVAHPLMLKNSLKSVLYFLQHDHFFLAS